MRRDGCWGIVLAIMIVGISHTAGADEANVTTMASNCGANCLQVILKMKGKPQSLEHIMNQPGLREGAPSLSLADLQRAMKTFGFDTKPVRLTPEAVLEFKEPLIAHIQKKPGDSGTNHYVVVWAKNRQELTVVDYPQIGPVQLNQFKKHFTGYALVFADEPALASAKEADPKELAEPMAPPVAPKPVKKMEKPARPGPWLAWPQGEDVDYGEISPQDLEAKTHRLIFQNLGDAPLQILEVKPSCGCMNAKVSAKTLQPGETGYVEIGIVKKEFGPFSEQVAIKTNMPEHTWQVASFRGHVLDRRGVLVSPGACVLEDIAEDRKTSFTFEFFHPMSKADPVPYDLPLSVSQVEGFTQKQVQATVASAWELDKDKRFATRKVTVEIDPAGLGYGIHRGRVLLKAGAEDKQLPILVRRTPLVTADRPAYLMTGQASQSMAVRLRSKGDIPFTLTLCAVKEGQGLQVSVEKGDTPGAGKELQLVRDKTAAAGAGLIQQATVACGGMAEGKPWTLEIPVTLVTP